MKKRKYRYFACSVYAKSHRHYTKAYFIVKDNGKSATDKIDECFSHFKCLMDYDGVYTPLTETTEEKYKEDYEERYCLIFKENIFGKVR